MACIHIVQVVACLDALQKINFVERTEVHGVRSSRAVTHLLTNLAHHDYAVNESLSKQSSPPRNDGDLQPEVVTTHISACMHCNTISKAMHVFGVMLHNWNSASTV